MGGVLNWKESGWPDWHLYQPIAAVALTRDLQQYPGNVDGPVVRNLARLGFDGLPDATSRALATNARWTEEDASALTVDLVDGHCGFMPESMIGPMGYVQRAKMRVAAALLEADVGDGAVLIAGNGHVRADRGVPRYLEPESMRVLSIGILEALPGVLDWQAYLDGRGVRHHGFTEGETPDRCEELRKRFGKNK